VAGHENVIITFTSTRKQSLYPLPPPHVRTTLIGFATLFSLQLIFCYPFSADVANKRHLGSAQKSHYCNLTGKTEVIDLSDLMTLFIDLGCFILHTDAKSIQRFQKHTKLIEN
jgi:hypothetical protein